MQFPPPNKEAVARPPESLLRQKVVAERLDVSVSYLRGSDCPKVLLPGRGKRPIVRYRWSEVEAWAEKWTARSTIEIRRMA